MVFLNKFAMEKVTLTCQLLVPTLLQKLVRFELHAYNTYVCSDFRLAYCFGVNCCLDV